MKKVPLMLCSFLCVSIVACAPQKKIRELETTVKKQEKIIAYQNYLIVMSSTIIIDDNIKLEKAHSALHNAGNLLVELSAENNNLKLKQEKVKNIVPSANKKK